MSEEFGRREASANTPRHVYKISRQFPYDPEKSSGADPSRAGHPARFAYKVFDSDGVEVVSRTDGLETVVRVTPVRQERVKALFFEDDRRIITLHLQRFDRHGDPASASPVFTFRGAEIVRLLNLLKAIEHADMPTADAVRFDEDIVRQAAVDPEVRRRAYDADREEFFKLIEGDENARDVVAVKRRRRGLAEFRRLLDDSDYVAAKIAELRKNGPEGVWQQFFEDNRWIFGFGLAPQVLLSWDTDHLESVVRGASVAGSGKRPDALMRTVGAMSSLSFVEIKLPTDSLVKSSSYRPDVWEASKTVVGGVAQCQATLDAAQTNIRERLAGRDSTGFETGIVAELCRPRSFLIVGNLAEFVEGERVSHLRFRAFENFRRSLRDPEILTFDELYERAARLVGDDDIEPLA